MNANDVEWVVESRDDSISQEEPPSLLSRPVASKRPSQQRRNKVQHTIILACPNNERIKYIPHQPHLP